MFGSILQAGASTVQGLINQSLVQSQNASDRDFARESATTAYNRQRELYHEMYQNDLSFPALQSQILASAGINPNLIAGGNIGSVPNTPTVAPSSVPNSHSAQFDLGLGDIAQRANELERIRAQNLNENALTEASVKEKLANAGLMSAKSDEVKANIDNIYSLVSLNKANSQHLSTLNEVENLRLANDLIDLIKRRSFLDDEFERAERDFGVSKLEYQFIVATQAARIRGVTLNAEKLASEIGLNKQEIERMKIFNKYADDLYKADSEDAMATALITGYDADLKSTYGDFEKILDLINSAESSAGDVTRLLRKGKYRRR